jgi:hypothetical protein
MAEALPYLLHSTRAQSIPGHAMARRTDSEPSHPDATVGAPGEAGKQVFNNRMRETAVRAVAPAARRHIPSITLAIAIGLLACLLASNATLADQPRAGLVQYLETRLSLTEQQARGALGALLVFAQQKLSKDDFEALVQKVPNATQIMQDVKLQGIVTRPLDDLDEYEASLTSLNIGQPLASQIPTAVLDYLGSTGHDEERDILATVLD